MQQPTTIERPTTEQQSPLNMTSSMSMSTTSPTTGGKSYAQREGGIRRRGKKATAGGAAATSATRTKTPPPPQHGQTAQAIGSLLSLDDHITTLSQSRADELYLLLRRTAVDEHMIPAAIDEVKRSDPGTACNAIVAYLENYSLHGPDQGDPQPAANNNGSGGAATASLNNPLNQSWATVDSSTKSASSKPPSLLGSTSFGCIIEDTSSPLTEDQVLTLVAIITHLDSTEFQMLHTDLTKTLFAILCNLTDSCKFVRHNTAQLVGQLFRVKHFKGDPNAVLVDLFSGVTGGLATEGICDAVATIIKISDASTTNKHAHNLLRLLQRSEVKSQRQKQRQQQQHALMANEGVLAAPGVTTLGRRKIPHNNSMNRKDRKGDSLNSSRNTNNNSLSQSGGANLNESTYHGDERHVDPLAVSCRVEKETDKVTPKVGTVGTVGTVGGTATTVAKPQSPLLRRKKPAPAQPQETTATTTASSNVTVSENATFVVLGSATANKKATAEDAPSQETPAAKPAAGGLHEDFSADNSGSLDLSGGGESKNNSCEQNKQRSTPPPPLAATATTPNSNNMQQPIMLAGAPGMLPPGAMMQQMPNMPMMMPPNMAMMAPNGAPWVAMQPARQAPGQVMLGRQRPPQQQPGFFAAPPPPPAFSGAQGKNDGSNKTTTTNSTSLTTASVSWAGSNKKRSVATTAAFGVLGRAAELPPPNYSSKHTTASSQGVSKSNDTSNLTVTPNTSSILKRSCADGSGPWGEQHTPGSNPRSVSLSQTDVEFIEARNQERGGSALKGSSASIGAMTSLNASSSQRFSAPGSNNLSGSSANHSGTNTNTPSLQSSIEMAQTKALSQSQKQELTSRTVYLNRLDPRITEGKLRDILVSCGTFNKVRLCGNPGASNAAGRARYAFVEFQTLQGARNLLKLDRTMHGDVLVQCLAAKSPIQDQDVSVDALYDTRRGCTRSCLFGLKRPEASKQNPSKATNDDHDACDAKPSSSVGSAAEAGDSGSGGSSSLGTSTSEGKIAVTASSGDATAVTEESA